MRPQIIPSSFRGGGKEGDFSWMIKNPKYDDSMFIFNENVESFKKKDKHAGGGNAVIRPYVYSNPVRAIGIPTGYVSTRSNKHHGGFKSLDSEAKEIIDEAFDKAIEVIKKNRPKRIFYSAKKDGSLGSSIFQINDDVIKYITRRIKDLENIDYSDVGGSESIKIERSVLVSVRKVSKEEVF